MTAIWLSRDDISLLEQHATKLRDRVIIQLGAFCGLRINEIVNLRVKDLYDEVVNNELRYFARINGKNTSQRKHSSDDKQVREIWIPREVYKDIQVLVNDSGISSDGHLIQSQKDGGLHVDSARRIVKDVAELVYESTGEQRFTSVSSHDLRRFFAHYLAEERGVNLRVVMDLGGWTDFESIKNYLDKPSKKTKAREMDRIGWS